MHKATPKQLIAGRYRLERKLARGGMGWVWEAHDEKLKRDVALKVMSGGFATSADARTRFEREAMAVAKLQTPHVVQIFDYGVEDDAPFIVMELLSGEDLRKRLMRVKRLVIDEVASLVGPIARALSVAHNAGIVHRDLKPGNVFLVDSGEDELVKVLDFGVAKLFSDNEDFAEERTKEGALLGTPQFMSPEQARGITDIDHRADLWSFGVIIFRALTGRLPFVGKAAGDVIVKICMDPIPKATEVAPNLPWGIDQFFERALARDRNERFDSARELALAFEDFAPVAYSTVSTAGRPSLSGLRTSRPPISGPTPISEHSRSRTGDSSWGDPNANEDTLPTWSKSPPTDPFDDDNSDTCSLDPDATRSIDSAAAAGEDLEPTCAVDSLLRRSVEPDAALPSHPSSSEQREKPNASAALVPSTPTLGGGLVEPSAPPPAPRPGAWRAILLAVAAVLTGTSIAVLGSKLGTKDSATTTTPASSIKPPLDPAATPVAVASASIEPTAVVSAKPSSAEIVATASATAPMTRSTTAPPTTSLPPSTPPAVTSANRTPAHRTSAHRTPTNRTPTNRPPTPPPPTPPPAEATDPFADRL